MLHEEKKISTVVFDLDGLMFDTESLYYAIISDFVRKRGKELTPKIMQKVMGTKGIEGITTLLGYLDIDDDPKAVQVQFRNSYGEMLYAQAKKIVMPGCFELLGELKERGIRVAVATSSYSGWVNILFTEHDLHDTFETVVTGNDVEHGKPHPETYLTILERLKLHPQECVVLEDAMHGVFAAKAAGCRVVAVPNKFTKDLDFSIADLCVDSLNHPKLREYIFSAVADKESSPPTVATKKKRRKI